MKTDDLKWGRVRSDPPCMECVVRSKKGVGVLRGSLKTKNAQNSYLGKVIKFQNNRICYFLTVLVQKFCVRSDPPPARLRVKFCGCFVCEG